MANAKGSQNTISAAGLLLTYWCPARCAHCYECSGPDRTAWMSVPDARRHLEALARLGVPTEGVHIGGGEPFGDFDRLLAVVRTAGDSALGGIGYVETNGYWATGDAVVRERLSALRDAGMRQISISADAFHQAFVDPASAQRLYHVARELLGERGVRARRWRFLQRPTDLRKASPDVLAQAYRKALEEFPERMTGRAARELAPMLPQHPPEAFSGDACAAAMAESAHVHVDPAGYVIPGTCAGLTLGRATDEAPLDAVLAAPRGRLWQTLVSGGPVALLKEAERAGYARSSGGYADKCHLCTEIRGHLQSVGAMAEELGPPEVYAEA